MVLTADVKLARKAAKFYRNQGWNPLPSRMDAKRPLCRFADLWQTQAPEWLWATRNPRWQTTNVQVMTGAAWGLVVVDLDGTEAVQAWGRITDGRTVPSTWVSGRGDGSVHIWFSLPEDVESVPYRTIWKGDGKHSGIEILGDCRLVTAPPSFHVVTGERYRFRAGCGPRSIPFPAEAPDWLLSMPAWEDPQPPAPIRPDVPRGAYVRTAGGGTWDRHDVVQAMSGRFPEIARRHGLDVTGTTVSRTGWIEARVPWTDDRRPSGGLNVRDGRFNAYGAGGVTISFFDLLQRLDPHRFVSWRDAVNYCGQEFGVAPRKLY